MFIQQDASDRLFYKEFLSESRPMQDLEKEGALRHFAFPEIAQDIFSMLYEPSPKNVDAPTPVGLRICKQNIDKIRELREYKELVRLCNLDAFASGLATTAMSKAFITLLPKTPEDPETLKGKKEVAEELSLTDKAAEIQDKIDSIEQYLAKVDPRIMDDDAARQKMRDALQNALKETRDGLDGMGAFGYDNDPGSMKQQGLKEKMELAKLLRNSAKLQEIAKLAGRFIRIAKKKQKEKMVSNTVSSVRMGDNLARTLPSELAKLASPILCGMFYKSFMEKTLLEYELRSKVPQGQGPIIFMMDGSGSMSGYPEMATKAIGMALAEIAKHEKRDFVMGQFGNAGEYREMQILTNNTVVIDNGKGGTEIHPCNPLYLMAELEFFFNGGTDFQRPLTEAIKHISGSKFQRADIIFATDGCAEITPAFMKEYQRVKDEKKFSCIGVLIGKEAKVLQSFCDELFHTDDLLADDKKNEPLQDRIFKI